MSRKAIALYRDTDGKTQFAVLELRQRWKLSDGQIRIRRLVVDPSNGYKYRAAVFAIAGQHNIPGSQILRAIARHVEPSACICGGSIVRRD